MEPTLRDKVIAAVTGAGAHVAASVALEELTAAQARRRPSRKLATIWEELAHVVFWQEFILQTVRGGQPQPPATAAGGWPAMPSGRSAVEAWEALKGRFVTSLAEIQMIARENDLEGQVGQEKKSTLGEQLLMLGTHNSYHFGQIVALRRLIGAWPPPSGGATW